MAIDVLFAIRGLLAFIAFTECTTAARCLLPDALLPASAEHYRLFSLVRPDREADRIISHLLGILCLLHGLVVIHLAIFSHYRPIASLALSFVAVKLLFILSHALCFRSIALDGHLIFPLVSGSLTLVAAVAVPFVTADSFRSNDENRDLLRKMKLPKRSKQS